MTIFKIVSNRVSLSGEKVMTIETELRGDDVNFYLNDHLVMWITPKGLIVIDDSFLITATPTLKLNGKVWEPKK